MRTVTVGGRPTGFHAGWKADCRAYDASHQMRRRTLVAVGVLQDLPDTQGEVMPALIMNGHDIGEGADGGGTC